MCLAVPARIVEMTGQTATVDMEGVRRNVSMMLLPDARVGEYVIVHAGFAIGRLDEKEAEETLRMIRDVLGSEQSADSERPRADGSRSDKE
jgi:hydrogenase expression/formation protein HypC